MSSLESKRLLVFRTIALTITFEIITLVSRFGLQIESTRDTAFLATFTLGLRIHHGYIGILIALASYYFSRSASTKSKRFLLWILASGLGLFLSDMLHHFLVLWPITGSPQFDLIYPPR